MQTPVQSDIDQFDHGSHWVTDQVAGQFLGFTNPFIIGLVKFGLIWDVLAATYLLTTGEEATTLFLASSGLGLFWVNIAPGLIWYYDERVLPRFFRDLSDLIPAESRDALSQKYTEYFGTHSLAMAVTFTAICVGAIHVNRNYLAAQGMAGNEVVFLWTSYAYAAFFGGVLATQGFTGSVATIRIVRDVCNMDLQIDPLHPDNLGGLSVIGQVAVSTTVLYSTASLFLPLLFRLASAAQTKGVVTLGIVIYFTGLLGAFLYPTMKVNREAQEVRNEELGQLRSEYRRVKSEMADASASDTAELNKRLELQRIQQEFDKYNNVRLYPMEIRILTRLGGSIVLPLLLLLLEFYLPSVLQSM